MPQQRTSTLPQRRTKAVRKTTSSSNPRPKRDQGAFPWWAAGIGLVFVGGMIVGLVLVLRPRPRPIAGGSTTDAGAVATAGAGTGIGTGVGTGDNTGTALGAGVNTATTAGGSLVGGGALAGAGSVTLGARGDFTLEQCRTYFMQMRDRTGKESPELRMLLDDPFNPSSQQLASSRCVIGGSHSCQTLQEVCRMLAATGTARRSAGKEEQSRWLAGLKQPDIPVANMTAVRHVFERYTVSPSDHEAFQSMYFRCGSYWESIKTLLTRYELPTGVMALVMTESGCVPTIESPVGAMGLWQLMPAAGRAYHLRVMDELDERRSPTKSTEAGIRYLADVYQKLGDWELTFASYNMGMYGVMARVARLQRAGIPKPTFWDLAENDLLPQETARYVPTIEAYALILENMRALRFTPDQRQGVPTGDLEVLPGTRLGLIAHAASTSVKEIRNLNPDILPPADRIPTKITDKFVVQVPRDNVFRARDALQQFLLMRDDLDQCVSDDFDWGKARFTKEMENECRRRSTSQLGGAAGSF
jgi:hypothetical protein